jgi:hypothetical protein
MLPTLFALVIFKIGSCFMLWQSGPWPSRLTTYALQVGGITGTCHHNWLKWGGVSWIFLSHLAWYHFLLNSAYKVARITGVSYCSQPLFNSSF